MNNIISNKNKSLVDQISDNSKCLNNGVISNDGFIVNKTYDYIWFIGAPIIAFIIALAFVDTSLANAKVLVGTFNEKTFYELFIGSFVMAHLSVVFYRSHGNYEIFKLYPVRFIIVPIVLILSITFSVWVATIIAVLAIWWDVYHSGLQTFGLGRIYDMRRGNDAIAGRRLDYLLNILIYAGPILAGATLMDHAIDFREFKAVDFALLSELPQKIFNHRSELTIFVFIIGVPFIIYYLYAYWRLYKRGYIVSKYKIILFALTALVSISSWGWNSFGEAFFIMNFFHAWQYMAIVWHFEKKTITSIFYLNNIKGGVFISLLLFIITAFTYGYWAETIEPTNLLYAIVLTVSILHFWYDGFIWSVRKKQV